LTLQNNKQLFTINSNISEFVVDDPGKGYSE
jgi:hypothetical protein